MQNALDQLIPRHSGWKLQTRRKDTSTAVIKTTKYLQTCLNASMTLLEKSIIIMQ